MDGQLRHAAGLARIGRVHPAELQEHLAVEMQLVGKRSEHREDLLAAVGLIAGLHGGVGSEHEVVAAAFERVT